MDTYTLDYERNVRIGLSEAILALRVVLGQYGRDHKAAAPGGGSGCIYGAFGNGGFVLTPVCIVGAFIHNLGLLRLTMTSDGFLGSCQTDDVLWDQLTDAGVIVENDARRFFRAVQSRQDSGMTWGDAFDGALATFQAKALTEVGLSDNPLFADWNDELVSDGNDGSW